MGLSRLTTNPDYKDFDSAGDRVLLVLLGNSVHHFATYNTAPHQNNVNGNIPYLVESEAEWTYVYFSYKRLSQTVGHAVAFTSFGSITSGIQMDVMHLPLGDYLQLTVGHAGKYYPNFNGQITTVRFNLGPGAFIQDKTGILARIKNKDPQPDLAAGKFLNQVILEGKHDVSKKLPAENPTMVDRELREYGMSLWFRWFKSGEKKNQLLYRFTSSSEEDLADTQKIGDRTLLLNHFEHVQFATYSLAEKDTQILNVPYTCNLP